MVWARLDDAILDNHKIAAVGVYGFALHVAAITWCCRNLSDGHIPYSRVGGLLPLEQVQYDMANPLAIPGEGSSMGGGTGLDAHDIADKLVEVGLWERTVTGYFLHDFLEYNPSRDEVLAKRDKAKERRVPRTSQQRTANVPRTSREPDANVARSSRLPGPDPDPLSPSLRSGENARASGEPRRLVMGEACPDGLHEDATVRAQCEMAGARMPTAADVVAMRSWFAENGKRSANWAASLVKWMGNDKVFGAKARNANGSTASKRRIDLGHAHQAAKEDYVDDWGDNAAQEAP